MSEEPDSARSHHARRWSPVEIVIVAAAIVAAVWALGAVLLLVFAAVVLAVGVDGLTSALSSRTRLPRVAALVLVLVGIAAALTAVGAAVLPPVISQLDALWARLVELYTVTRDWIVARGDWTTDLLDGIEEEAGDMLGGFGQIVVHLGAVGVTTFGMLTSFVLIVVMAAFLAADPGLYRRGFLRLVPSPRRALVEETLGETAHALRWWFLAQFTSMAILGISIGAGLYLIGIEFWLSLALITALLTFIPYLGPVLAGIPVVAIGFAEGPQTGVVVLLFYLVVQNIEANILLPLIYQMTVRLAPAVTIAAQVFMGLWFGVAGFVLAAPLTVAGMVLVRKLYIEAALGDHG